MTDSQFREPFFLGVDLGGTNIKAGVVDDHGRTVVHSRVSTEANHGPDRGVSNILRVVATVLDKGGLNPDRIASVGLATPGPMDIPAGKLCDPPNLPGWKDYPIRERVSDGLQKLIVLQNDANAAAYGEYWAGGAREANSLVFWTLGTGIGSGIIINDVIVQGEHSHGGECGHIIIEMDNGRPCATGQSGTLEAYASATALIHSCREAMAAGRETSLRAVTDRDGGLTPILIAEAATAGDPLAVELIMHAAKFLGVGTTTLMHTIDPDMVLFGGAMTFGRHATELGRQFIDRIREEVRHRAFPVPYASTVIDYAVLGGRAGYIGAAGCARREFTRVA